MAQSLGREVRRRRALAGDGLVRHYRAGLLKDRGHVADLLALTGLLAEDDPRLSQRYCSVSMEVSL